MRTGLPDAGTDQSFINLDLSEIDTRPGPDRRGRAKGRGTGMTQAGAASALRRMAEAGRAPPAAAAMTPARAVGQALALAAQEMLMLPLRVERAEDLRLSLSELLEVVEPLALLAILEGPHETLGLAALTPGTLATLIEMQTMGRIGAASVDPRRPTRTDAAMSAGILDRILGEVETLLATDEAIIWAGGFRYGSFLDDPRPLGLVLEEGGYRVMRLTLAFGAEGARQGGLLLALPLPGRGNPPVASRRPGTGRPGAGEAAGTVPGDAEGQWRARLEQAVMQAPAELHAVMGRISLPLSAVMALRPGAEIELPADALSRMRVEGADGRLLTLARLGQMRGHRALRLKARIEAPDLTAEPGGQFDDAEAVPPPPRRKVGVLDTATVAAADADAGAATLTASPPRATAQDQDAAVVG